MSHSEAKKLQLLKDGMWQGTGGEGTSGMLDNLGKSFFQELAVASVHDVNDQRDKKHGINYARKTMI